MSYTCEIAPRSDQLLPIEDVAGSVKGAFDGALDVAVSIKCYTDLFWWLNVGSQTALVIFGALATILVALQTENTGKLIRHGALVCTASLAILSGFNNTFRIKDNYDKLADLEVEAFAFRNSYVKKFLDDRGLLHDNSFATQFHAELQSLIRKKQSIVGSFGAKSE